MHVQKPKSNTINLYYQKLIFSIPKMYTRNILESTNDTFQHLYIKFFKYIINNLYFSVNVYKNIDF